MSRRTTGFFDDLRLAAHNVADTATGLIIPTLRLGVTGLSRSGKTVFISALVHHLMRVGTLPLFTPQSEHRFIGAKIKEQPDKHIPHFAAQNHMQLMMGEFGSDASWPQSTTQISQIRLELKFQRSGWLAQQTGPSSLNLDIIDYPGEWLLDLPLLTMDYAQFSAQSLGLAHQNHQLDEARKFIASCETMDANLDFDEQKCAVLADQFRTYLTACRAQEIALFKLPPGRFLMPGELKGSPALNFAPLPKPNSITNTTGLYATMQKRFEAYKAHIVRPFFLDHFARLDRQIVLVDLLGALNAGAHSVANLSDALGGLLDCFRHGAGSVLTNWFDKRIDKILFAATKADLVHHTQHDRLERLMAQIVAEARQKAHFNNTQTAAIALAGVRTTKEGNITQNGEDLPCLIGTPLEGESLNDEMFDGQTSAAIFPGDVPKSLQDISAQENSTNQFVRFCPPEPQAGDDGQLYLPHIRLDRALDTLLSDKMS